MDARTAHILADATNRFYAKVEASFSETRQQPWPGWMHVLELARTAPDSPLRRLEAQPLRLLDIGCGNMRFERFLQEQIDNAAQDESAQPKDAKLAERATLLETAEKLVMPETAEAAEMAKAASTSASPTIDALMLDACKFNDASFPGRFIEMDIIQALENGEMGRRIGANAHDLVVSFGVMHHIPLASWRHDMLRDMLRSAAPGGIVAVSLWRPLDSARIARKAEASTMQGCRDLDVQLSIADGDMLLGWQSESGIYRYCHHFSEREVGSLARLAEREGCKVLSAFSPSDGSDSLNTYLVISKPQR